jgi:hypothetical protein
MAGIYVLPLEAVQESRRSLAGARIHSTFAGYLCVRHAARREGRRTGLRPNFATFFQSFLSVGDGKTPYVMPFNESGRDNRNHYFNKNVAGSYTQSSLRGVSPLLKVIGLTGKNNNQVYSLRDGDAALAYEHLLYKQQVDALALATFLYRNWALQLDQPTPGSLISLFCDDFSFSDKDFQTLFSKPKDSSAIKFEDYSIASQVGKST